MLEARQCGATFVTGIILGDREHMLTQPVLSGVGMPLHHIVDRRVATVFLNALSQARRRQDEAYAALTAL
jgi:hypothetical protein